MTRFYRHIAIIFILVLNGVGGMAQSFDACQLYGQVFVTQDHNQANFKVFIEETEAFPFPAGMQR